MPKIMTQEGFNINYEIHGTGAPERTIILSHGNGNSINEWKTMGYVEKLAPGFRLVLMDALGYGDSDKPSESQHYTAERRAADVIAVLDGLGIDQAHFFGASIGGSLGFVLADLYPDRFYSFMIGSAHPYGSSKPYSNVFGEELRNIMAKDGMKGFLFDLETRLLLREFPEGVRKYYILNDPQALIAANTPVWPDRSSCLQKINVPVLLYAGALDPISEYLPKYAKKISNCTTRIISDTDHCDAFWDSSKVVPLLRDFLEKNFPKTT